MLLFAPLRRMDIRGTDPFGETLRELEARYVRPEKWATAAQIHRVVLSFGTHLDCRTLSVLPEYRTARRDGY